MLYVDCSLLCSTALSKLGASTAMVQCIAQKWDGHRCSLQAKPGHRLCGNHLKGTRYGLIELPGPEEVQHEEPLEGQQQREGEQHQEVPQDEQQAGGDAEGIPEDDGRIPEQQMLQEESGKLDIDMFLLPVSLETVASISNFWVSTHTPPPKLFSERPGFLQLFHHPMAMFLELPHNCEVQDFKAKVCQLLYDSGVDSFAHITLIITPFVEPLQWGLCFQKEPEGTLGHCQACLSGTWHCPSLSGPVWLQVPPS